MKKARRKPGFFLARAIRRMLHFEMLKERGQVARDRTDALMFFFQTAQYSTRTPSSAGSKHRMHFHHQASQR